MAARNLLAQPFLPPRGKNNGAKRFRTTRAGALYDGHGDVELRRIAAIAFSPQRRSRRGPARAAPRRPVQEVTILRPGAAPALDGVGSMDHAVEVFLPVPGAVPPGGLWMPAPGLRLRGTACHTPMLTAPCLENGRTNLFPAAGARAVRRPGRLQCSGPTDPRGRTRASPHPWSLPSSLTARFRMA